MSPAAARTKLASAAAKMHASTARADTLRAAFKAAVLDAWTEGLTYEEIAEVSELSRPRIDQVLRQERLRRGIHVNTKK